MPGQHRRHSTAFKRQVVEEHHSGSTLHALGKKHDICRQLIRVWFGASVSSAIRWVADWRASGRTAPRAQGGDRRSDRIEAEAAFLLARVAETPDITLAELREALWRERGVRVAVSTLWRFFDRRRITLKKRRRMPPSRSART